MALCRAKDIHTHSVRQVNGIQCGSNNLRPNPSRIAKRYTNPQRGDSHRIIFNIQQERMIRKKFLPAKNEAE
jgi:hypothetical protein